MIDILERHGGWPVVKGDEWTATNWSWIGMLKNMSNDGLPTNFLLEAIVDIDQNDTSKYIITVKQCV